MNTAVTNTRKARIAIVLSMPFLYLMQKSNFSLLTIWVLSPLIVSYLGLYLAQKFSSQVILNSIYVYTAISASLILYIHIQWFFDINSFRSGSSTSALVFLFVPFYAFIFGGIGYLLCLWWMKSE